MKDKSGNWVQTSERIAKSVDIAEPPSAMFEIPPYPIRTYADIDAELKQRLEAR